MTKRMFLSLFFVSLFPLTYEHALSEEKADTERMYSTIVEGVEYTMLRPKNLCPFTIEVYPEKLYPGDPLYARLNFRNNTDTDAYEYVSSGPSYSGEYRFGVLECYLKTRHDFFPWLVTDGMWSGSTNHIWQKIEPGKNGLLKYLSLYDLTTTYIEDGRYVNLPDSLGEDLLKGIAPSEYESVSGQLVVAINNIASFPVLKDPRTLMVVSPPILFKPRPREEMDVLNKMMKNFEEHYALSKKDIECLILKLTPGTLRNQFQYQLMLFELEEFIESTSEIDATAETRILEILAQIDNFLKPLHEIERENLKLSFGNSSRAHIRAILRDNEKLLKRLNEVFGEIAPVRIPLGVQGGM